MLKQASIGAATVLSLGLLAAGCSEDGDTIVSGGGGLLQNTDATPFSGLTANNLANDGGGLTPNGSDHARWRVEFNCDSPTSDGAYSGDGSALVLFSTHVLPEIEAVTDRLLLIARGQVVAQGEMNEIRELLDEHPHHIRVRCDRPRDLASALLAKEGGVVALHFPDDSMLEVRTWQPDETYSAIAEVVLENGFRLDSMTSPDANLEALFHYLVERANRGAGSGADAGSGSMQGLQSAAQKSAYAAQLEPGGGR